jgi:hypothetical protein
MGLYTAIRCVRPASDKQKSRVFTSPDGSRVEPMVSTQSLELAAGFRRLASRSPKRELGLIGDYPRR